VVSYLVTARFEEPPQVRGVRVHAVRDVLNRSFKAAQFDRPPDHVFQSRFNNEHGLFGVLISKLEEEILNLQVQFAFPLRQFSHVTHSL